ncbi:MAG: 50S ribosomal protein L10 [Candidatus Zambryskibacteria bacterium RIFCSPLOWO2_12_FULL_39_23]|uniref:Large ribosomal subunit protein uL10 n=1 Tax=Candidatus Zambryskibacteria bacterium RIFCSPLOWO2_12_FULL_39_23 TaxID=1802776 RepID=A0A1G2US95_9BACT|nr:MAG: 50S ribosomal protein L10 [Candidatus Zambryskibacteria bacterium RIFCSPLOWO2_12_FULL_39_23]
MAVSKEKKGEILTKLKKILKDSAGIVFINFHSLPVSESTKIRKVLRERDIGYTIAKKTLTRKALSENNIAGNMPEMPGELGIVYGTDPLDSAREIYSFQKSLDKKVQIIGGIFEGKFMNREEMVSIAQIPGLKTLQAQFVNLINSPIQGFVMALSEIAKKKV